MKKIFIGTLALILLAVTANAVVLPYTFTAGQQIRANEVNANDQALRDGVNNHAAAANAHHTSLSQVLSNGYSTGLYNIDFNGKSAINVRIENVVVDPSPGNKGRMIFNTVDGKLKVDDGAAWRTVGGALYPDLETILANGNVAGRDIDMSGHSILSSVISAASNTITELGNGAIANGAGIAWSKIDKAGSSLSELTTKAHSDLSGIGTNTHAQIDAHIANTSNPHSVTASQVGSAVAQWNADKILGLTVDDSAIGDQKALKYDAISGKLVYGPAGGGLPPGGSANQIVGKNAANSDAEYKTITGTINQIGVDNFPGEINLFLAQDIHPGADVAFNSVSSSFIGSLSGNASTASEFDHTPSACGANTFATSIASSGNLSCSAIGDSGLSTSYIKADGTRGLSGDWNAGAHIITATQFVGDLSGQATTAGTAANFSGNLFGDVQGTQGATEVKAILGYPVDDTTQNLGWAMVVGAAGTYTHVQQIPMSYLDTDASLTGNSDAKVASQKAVRSYVGTKTAAVGYSTQNFTGVAFTVTADRFQRHRYTGSSAQTMTAPTLTLIPDGGMVIIIGTSNTNTITIPEGLTGIVKLNGPIELGLGNTITFMQDATLGGLYEISRS